MVGASCWPARGLCPGGPVLTDTNLLLWVSVLKEGAFTIKGTRGTGPAAKPSISMAIFLCRLHTYTHTHTFLYCWPIISIIGEIYVWILLSIVPFGEKKRYPEHFFYFYTYNDRRHSININKKKSKKNPLLEFIFPRGIN